MKLITETTYNISTKKDEKSLYIEGIFSTAEERNRNGRIYSKKILEREVDKLRENILNKSSLGELEHPASNTITLERAAILIEDLVWEKNHVMGKAKVLSTPCGQIVKSLIEDGARIGISSRGLGTVNEKTNYVNEDFNLICWDIVSQPSNRGSWVNGVLESVDFANPGQEKLVEQAKKEYKKRIFQVIEQISKNL